MLLCAVFFTYTAMSPTQGFFWMGVMVIGMTALYMTVYFPMWGGMFCAAKPGVTEEDYYMSGGLAQHPLLTYCMPIVEALSKPADQSLDGPAMSALQCTSY